MWKLSVEDDQANKTLVNLVRDEYLVGRGEDANVRLTERNISRRHAQLRRSDTSWVIEDLDSYNGCYVNGVRVGGEHPLEHGDLIQLGDYRLALSDESRSATAGGAATLPAVPKSQSLLGQPDRLVMLVGPTPGTEYALVGERILLGRGEECDICINHSSVSRVHAELQRLADGRYELIDRESANGVRVNGVDLLRGFVDGRDNVQLGDVRFKFIRAGQIYRPGAGESQQIEAVAFAERTSPLPGVATHARPQGVSSTVKAVLGVAFLALLVVLGMVAFGGSKKSNTLTTGPEAASQSTSADVLAEAVKIHAEGRLEDAHVKVTTEIPDDSNLKQSPEFKKIEADWADAMFKRAEGADSTEVKRGLYDKVAKTATVDSVRRKRAAAAVAALDGGEAVNVTDLPSAAIKKKAAAGADPDSDFTIDAVPSAKPVVKKGIVRKDPYATGGKKKTGSTAEDLLSGNRQKLLRARSTLLARANSGRASKAELQQLKAVCGQLRDAACRAKAHALLANK